MAGPTISFITLSGDTDKLSIKNDIFNFKIQDMVQPSS